MNKYMTFVDDLLHLLEFNVHVVRNRKLVRTVIVIGRFINNIFVRLWVDVTLCVFSCSETVSV